MSHHVTYVYPDLYDEHDSDSANQARRRLFAAVLYLLRREFAFDSDGALLSVEAPEQPGEPARLTLKVEPRGFGDLPLEVKLRVLAVIGRMMNQGFNDPTLGQAPAAPRSVGQLFYCETTAASEPQRIQPRFIERLRSNVAHFTANQALYEKVYRYLCATGEPLLREPSSHEEPGPWTDAMPEADAPPPVTVVFAAQLARVVDGLVAAGVSATHPQIGLHIAGAVGEAGAAPPRVTGEW